MGKERTIRISKELYEVLDEIGKKNGISKIKASKIIAKTFINNATLKEKKRKPKRRKIEIRYEFRI